MRTPARLSVPRPPKASPESLALAGLWSGLQDLALAAILVFALVEAMAPPQDLPWKPLRLADPPGLATGWKLEKATGDAALCRQVLAEGGVELVEAPIAGPGGCGAQDAIRLQGGTTPLASPRPATTCPVALGYAFWTRHVVQPAARDLLDADVARIEHYGAYACRNVYGRETGRRSEHATANALDVAAFRLEDGRRIRVAESYRGDDAAAAFLRRVRDGACGYFTAVLSPDYNAAHADHFHLDHGRWRVCR